MKDSKDIFIEELRKDLAVRKQDYEAVAEKRRRESNPAENNNLSRQLAGLQQEIETIKQQIEHLHLERQGNAVRSLIACLNCCPQRDETPDYLATAYRMAMRQRMSIGAPPTTIKAIVDDLHSRSYGLLGEYPVLHRFVMCLLVMQQLPPEAVAGLNQWVSENIDESTLLRQEIECELEAQDEKKPCLLVKVSASPKSPDTYYVLAWFLEDRESYRDRLLKSGQSGATQLWPERKLAAMEQSASKTMGLAEAEGRDRQRPTYAKADLEGVFRQLRQHCVETYRKPELIQVFLPAELLNYQLEHWAVGPRKRRVFGTESEILLCSIERLEQLWLLDLGGDWHRKWDDVEHAFSHGAQSIFEEGDPQDLDSLYGKLVRARTLAAKLTQAVNDSDAVEVLKTILLDSATPLAIWLRENLAGLDCCHCLGDVLNVDCVGKLPATVRAKRAESMGQDQLPHVGQGLVLLWDDPRCPPPDVAELVLSRRAS